jgi:hypothetical protein
MEKNMAKLAIELTLTNNTSETFVLKTSQPKLGNWTEEMPQLVQPTSFVKGRVEGDIDLGVDCQPAYSLQVAGSVGKLEAHATFKVGDNAFWNTSGSIGTYQIQSQKEQTAGLTMNCTASIQG